MVPYDYTKKREEYEGYLAWKGLQTQKSPNYSGRDADSFLLKPCDNCNHRFDQHWEFMSIGFGCSLANCKCTRYKDH